MLTLSVRRILIRGIWLVRFFIPASLLQAQDGKVPPGAADSASEIHLPDYAAQRDLIDVALKIVGKNTDSRIAHYKAVPTGLRISGGPNVEYALATGFTAGLAIGGQFLTSRAPNTSISSFLLLLKFTQKHQLLVPLQTAFRLKEDKYYLIGDWRYLYFPQDSYGFGTKTTPSDVFTISYDLFRFYETFLRRIRLHLYGGLGYQLDRRWNIKQENIPPGRITDFTKYGYAPESTSSAITLNLLYDVRSNPANPQGGGSYANIVFSDAAAAFGSSSSWTSLLIDLRKYIRLSPRALLALWSYNVFTLGGNPPYLDLPGPGNDTYNNAGRGYEQGRFVGKKMVDLEAELRFGISHNGLIGGVIFANAESVSEYGSNRFESIAPAAGAGLRIKFNKFSSTNLCIDFGVGKANSHGFFGNLGENF